MKTFSIDVPEIHYATFRIEANTLEEALNQVAFEGDGNMVGSDYVETIEPDERAYYAYDEDSNEDGWYVWNYRNGKWEEER